MAKSRYGKKRTGHRKSPKRVRAGKKAWRARVKRYGSKAAAIRATFGRGRGKGKSRGGHRRRFGGGGLWSRTHRMGGAAILARIQRSRGTTGLPPTDAEVSLARKIVERSRKGASRSRFGTPKLSGEARHRAAFAARLAQEKRREAARRVAYDLRVRAEERRRAEHDARIREHEAAIASEMGRL